MAHTHSGGRGRGHRPRYDSGRWGVRQDWWGPSGYGGDTEDPRLVKWIQSCLMQSVGSWVPQTGRLGRATRHALRTFQSQSGLPLTGLPDTDTVAQIQRACGAGANTVTDTVPGSHSSPIGSHPDMSGEVSSSAEFRRGKIGGTMKGYGEFPDGGRGTQTLSQHGRWFRKDDRVIVLLGNPPARNEQELEDGPAAPPEDGVVRTAIQRGVRDENRLTDMIFSARHPERRGRRLQAQEQALVREWMEIRDRLVRPQLQAPNRVGPPVPAPQVQPAAKPRSTTSGVEAAGNTTGIIHCILGLQDQGRSITFVQSYLRDLTGAEISALKHAGLRIVSCYEENGPDPPVAFFTRAQGKHDGRRGFTQAQAVGQPAGTPVYFAVDTDPSAGQRVAILEYFQGIAEGRQQYVNDMKAQNKPVVDYAIGVYGSGCLLSWCKDQGIATWFWQAFAPGWCPGTGAVWVGANIHTSGRDQPTRCGWRLGHLEGWGNEGAW
jgi:Domain of unknown function (DUF1906)/Putative peptidoglycan binding domain